MANLYVGQYRESTYFSKTRPKPAAAEQRIAERPQSVTEETLAEIMELVINDCEYADALVKIGALPKEQIENNPELWALLIIAYSHTSNSAAAKSWTAKFNAWQKDNPDDPRAVNSQLLIFYRTLRFSEGIGLAEKTLASEAGLNKFSPLEKKLFYLLAGSCCSDVLCRYVREMASAAKKGGEYLELSLNINAGDGPYAKFIDYYSHLSLCDVYKTLANFSDDPTEKSVNFDKAVVELEKALSIKPDAWRPCMMWKIMLRDKDTARPASDQCRTNYPQDPPTINIIIEEEK